MPKTVALDLNRPKERVFWQDAHAHFVILVTAYNIPTHIMKMANSALAKRLHSKANESYEDMKRNAYFYK